MKHYVADTHAVLWFFADASKLGSQARRVFETLGVRSTVYVSSVSLWEVAVLYERGHVRLPLGFSAWRAQLAVTDGFRLEALLPEDIEEARALGPIADPFDRLLAGTALRLSASLITKDERLRRSRRVRTLW